MREDHRRCREFLVGTVLGGALLGGVTALLVAPKAGKKLRQDLLNCYSDLSDKAQDVIGQVSRKRGAFFGRTNSQAGDWLNCARSTLCRLARKTGSQESGETYSDFLIGGVAGGILGAVAALLLTPKSGSEIREDLREAYDDIGDRAREATNGLTKSGRSVTKNAQRRLGRWLDIAQEIVEDLRENAEEMSDEMAKGANRIEETSGLDKFLRWAALGCRVWKGIKSRR